MARTIQTIKAEITSAFIADATVREKYQLKDNESFDNAFSKASIESILFYVVSVAIWTLETIFDLHRSDVSSMIESLKPHSLQWYVSKAKSYLHGLPLIDGTDIYDTSDLSVDEVEQRKVVKYSSAVERNSVVYIKVAGDSAGEPMPITVDQLAGFRHYISEVKDAGVVVEVVNLPAEHFRIRMDIYYDPMVLNGNGVNFAGRKPIPEAIKEFIKGLPFNGEYRNLALIDTLQQIPGVIIPELMLAETSTDGQVWTAVNAKTTPLSGYYKVYDENKDLNIVYKAYESL